MAVMKRLLCLCYFALRNQPNLGRVGAEAGIRELVIGGTPYVVLYSVKRTQVTISTIWHGAQSRKTLGTSGGKAK
jgi:plasmid stabilization system protein ParE